MQPSLQSLKALIVVKVENEENEGVVLWLSFHTQRLLVEISLTKQ